MSAPHMAYVVGAYVASAVGIAALVIDTLMRARRWKTAAQLRDKAGDRNSAP